MSLPIFFDYQNTVNSALLPSTVHCDNTALSYFFQKYLLQKAISVFRFRLPELWPRNYFTFILFCCGFISVIETDKYGVVCQQCGLEGYDLYYQPTHTVITNPLLTGILRPRIGTECSVIKLQPNYSGVMDLVQYYGNLLALSAETLSGNLLNSKLSYVFTAADKTAAESFKKLYDKVASGEPAVVQDKKLLLDDGSPAWQSFSQNVGQNYIADRVLSDMRKIEAEFDTVVGIPNANTDKRERLITDEVNANNYETRTRVKLWLEEMQKGMEQAHELFGLTKEDLWVELYETEEGGEDNESNNDTVGAV